MSEQDHPAVKANINSITYAMEGKKEEWLALYADDVFFCDPVGVSPMDPTGEGHHGKAAVEGFWDNIIGKSNLTIEVQKRWISGDSVCCVAQTATNDLGDGKKTVCEMLAVYEVDDAGLIKRMQAHWDYADVDAQIQKLFA